MRNDKNALLESIAELKPPLQSRAAEIDRERHLPADIVDRLRKIGVYRMLAPTSYGGSEITLPDAVAVIAALARIDASIAWNVFVAAGGALLSPLLPRHTYEKIYSGGPDVIGSGASQPAGTAERVAQGWRVKGRWPIVSGAKEADWIGGLCAMTENGKPLPNPGGESPVWMRLVVLPAQKWQLEDTWHSLGLRGTGSVHVTLAETIVSDDQFIDLANGQPCVSGPLYLSPIGFVPLLQSAIAVGNAEGTLDDLMKQASTGWQQQNAASAAKDSEYFQAGLGRVAADIRAARAMLDQSSEAHWRQVLAGNAHDKLLHALATQAAVWIVETCVHSVDACFSLGGTGAIYDTSPLQRRLRDMHTSSQHYQVQARHYAGVGKLMLQSAEPGYSCSP
jgi:indole-3-acetate monooxygenase